MAQINSVKGHNLGDRFRFDGVYFTAIYFPDYESVVGDAVVLRSGDPSHVRLLISKVEWEVTP